MKKRIVLVLCLFLTLGCSAKKPEEAVRKYLEEYRNFSKNVENLVTQEAINLSLTEEEQRIFFLTMKKQFVHLEYKIKEVFYNGSQASVKVDITVYDFSSYQNIKKDLEKMSQEKRRVKYTIIFTTHLEKEWQVKELTDETIQKIMGFNKNIF